MILNNLVAQIQMNEVSLKEHGNIVYMPFDSEYSIWFRNADKSNVNIRILIDDVDVFEDELILEPGNNGSIYRFVEDNKPFQLLDNSIITIKFKFEQKNDRMTAMLNDLYCKFQNFMYNPQRSNVYDGAMAMSSVSANGSRSYVERHRNLNTDYSQECSMRFQLRGSANITPSNIMMV